MALAKSRTWRALTTTAGEQGRDRGGVVGAGRFEDNAMRRQRPDPGNQGRDPLGGVGEALVDRAGAYRAVEISLGDIDAHGRIVQGSDSPGRKDHERSQTTEAQDFPCSGW